MMMVRAQSFLLTLGLLSLAQFGCAQQLRVAITAAATRQFANVFAFSHSNSPTDMYSAQGLPAYWLGAKLLYPLNPHWQVEGGLRYNRFKTDLELSQTDAPALRSIITWEGRGGAAQLPVGVVYVLKPRAKVAPVVGARAVFGVGHTHFDQKTLTLTGYHSDAGYQQPSSVSVIFTDLTEYPVRAQFGLEASVGLRMEKGLELNAHYYHGLTKFAPVRYSYDVNFQAQDGQTYSRDYQGTILGRPGYVAAELVVYFN